MSPSHPDSPEQRNRDRSESPDSGLVPLKQLRGHPLFSRGVRLSNTSVLSTTRGSGSALTSQHVAEGAEEDALGGIEVDPMRAGRWIGPSRRGRGETGAGGSRSALEVENRPGESGRSSQSERRERKETGRKRLEQDRAPPAAYAGSSPMSSLPRRVGRGRPLSFCSFWMANLPRAFLAPLRSYSQKAQSPPTASSSGPAPLLRALWRSTAQPVAVITACLPTAANSFSTTGAHNHGATLSSLSSISLAPPLVAFSLRLPSRLAAFLLPAPASPRTLRVHLLSSTQEPIARAFARQVPLPHPAAPSPPLGSGGNLDELPFPPSLFAELESGSLGALECTVVHTLPLSAFEPGEVGQGSPRSQLFVARVEGSTVPDPEEGRNRGSLVYWEQGYHGVGG